MKILIGTNNAHKAQEIRDMLPEHEIVRPKDIGLDLDVDENGKTFEENALIKARAFAKASGIVTLADDSGLEVDCLNGEPGIYSARYCPKPGADDADRRQYLLQNIRACGAERPWHARFVCEIAVVFPGEHRTILSRGTCEGEIIPEERGHSGFGYDPIFYKPDKGMTLAEMTEEEKNAISHRGNAVKKIAPLLAEVEANEE
ncbi:MAG: RdgB/HAM1 family non-canonical purine NTP pyrophosphatase [Flexilinea sp.]|nr:RdgB/HAM1 family non-canonical purine NTP pyrophosphatase [Flexilinea sp.]